MRTAVERHCIDARLGNAEATYQLGRMYAIGNGVETNMRHAAALCRQATALGHGNAKLIVQVIRTDDAALPDCVIAAAPLPSNRVSAAAKQPLIQRAGGKTDQIGFAPTAPPTDSSPRMETEAGELFSQPIDGKRQVSEALTNWLAAWSRRNLAAYLATYSPEFEVPAGRSREQWVDERHARILWKSWISVKINALEIDLSGSVARAQFFQEYRSDKLSETSRKTLTLVKLEDKWLIRQELAR